MKPDTIIKIDNVSFRFDGPLVLDHVSLNIAKGEFLGIVGPNGGGKSTLLKLVLGLLEPESGAISVLGKSPRRGRSAIGYVPQYAAFERSFPITVQDAVLLGLMGKSRRIFGYANADYQSVRNALKETEIGDLKDRLLNTLSGGQLQRMLIARALVSKPEILILDEPTSNIDSRVEEDIFDLLKRLNERSTILVVSHDIGFISEYVTRVACLNRTLVCHETSAISGKTIEELYGSPVHMIQHSH
ncbi:MAG: ABC transporter ATP-binding protein [Gammaproteobacteria bacterium]|nr:ABC transporter ATP-binding protein [Gammaproteobacteria bacterium]